MNKTIQNKKIINLILLYVLLIYILQLQVSAQNNTFYTMQDGKFFYNCEEKYPMFINYSVDAILDINDEFHISPTVHQCYCNTECEPWWSCGIDKYGWRNEMIDHFKIMDSLKFDIIRLVGLGLQYVDSTNSLNTAKFRKQDNSNPDCYETMDGLEMMDTSNYVQRGDLLQEVIDIIKIDSMDLKLLILMGSDSIELLPEKYTDYLAYMSNRFKDEPVIFGYDLYNEPSNNNIQEFNKYDIASRCFDWYDAIKQHAPAHFVTMGVHVGDVFRWDPEILPLDFISFHMYTKRYEWELTDTIPPEPYAYKPSEDRYNAFLKWISLSFTKPVIIGETGLSAIDPDHVPTDSIIHPKIETEINQKIFAEFVLKYTNWYGHIGFSWWKYKDTRWGDPNTIKAVGSYHGLVYSEKYIISGIETLKPAADAFINYVQSTCDTCSDPETSVYLNPNSLTHTNPVFGEDIGLVTDGVQGVPNAYVVADVYNTNLDSTIVSYAITNDNGEYKIYTPFNPDLDTVIIHKIACSYAAGEFHRIDAYNGELDSLPDFVLPALNPGLLPQIQDYVNWTIEADTTWENMQVPGPNNVIVKEGATLTIKSTVYFNSNAKLIVNRGGKLIIDENGVLTSNCDSAQWQGVELHGNCAKEQSYNYQGMVVMSNGGTIENAIIGINTISYAIPEGGVGESPNYAYTGGIVIGDGGIFKNNRTAVKFWPYNHSTSVSLFRNCQFITDDNLLFGTDPDKFIEMRDISGVHIHGGSFTDSHTVTNPDELITGIETFDASFNIWTYNGPCVFTSLYYGIRAFSTSTNTIIEVGSAIFANNIYGIYLGGTNNASVTNCEFYTRDNYSGGYGLYLDESEGYTIEENVFTQGTSSYNGVGLIVNHTGPLGDNVIYRNQFYDLQYAVLAQNENRTGDEAGLQFRCNEFDPTCTYNIIVSWKEQKVTYNAGIAVYQGADDNAPDAPAGNRFSQTGPAGTTTDIYNAANDITYFYHVASPSLKLKPEYVTEGKVKLDPVDGALWIPEESCPPSEGGGGGSGDIEEMKGRMVTSGYNADSLQSIINILKDGGSTEDMKWEVDMSTPPETYEVYNELMSNSPYISDTVMEAAIEKEEVLPNVMIRDVMVANPHNAKNQLLMEKIEERSDPMPNYMKAQILQGSNLVSVFEELQSRRAFYQQQRTDAYNRLVKCYMTDTINTTASVDSLMILLENENSPGAKYRLAFLRLEQGAWDLGQTTIGNIPQQFNLEGEELERHVQMVSFYNLLSDLAQDGKTVIDADSMQVEALFEIEAAQMGLPSVYARNVLLALAEISYEEPILLPDFTKSTAIHQEYEVLQQALEEHHYIKVHPNPAVDYLIIEHMLEMEPKNAYAEIRNIKGEFIMDMKLSGKQNQQTIHIKELKPGIYIITLYVDNKDLESIKFTKVN